MLNTRSVAARYRPPRFLGKRTLIMLWRFPAQCPAATRPSLPHAPPSLDGAPPAPSPPSLTPRLRCKRKRRSGFLRRRQYFFAVLLALDQALLTHSFGAKSHAPAIGGCRAEKS